MFEGFRKLYAGEKVFSRQLALFSICGIVGLFNALVSLDKLALAEVTLIQKCAFLFLWILFAFFLIFLAFSFGWVFVLSINRSVLSIGHPIEQRILKRIKIN